MPIRAFHLIDGNVFDAAAESVVSTQDLGGLTVKRASLYVVLSGLVGAPTDDLNLSVDFSPDDGQTLVDYDKLQTDAGTDAPASSVVYAGPQVARDDVVDISPETVFDYIAVTLAASNAGAQRFTTSHSIIADVWLVIEY